MPRRAPYSSHKGFGYWATKLLSVVLALTGLLLLGGGLWLMTLGGSWYYGLAGIGILATAVLLWQRAMLAVWIYLLTYFGTVAWAMWEAGFNGWAQVPRLVAPTVLLILVLLTIPALRGPHRAGAGLGRNAFAASVTGMAALGMASAIYVATTDTPAIAQVTIEAPAQEPTEPAQPTETAPPETPAPAAGEAVPGAAQPEAGAPEINMEQAAPGAPASPEGQAETLPAVAAQIDYQMPTTGENWPAYGGTHHAERYSPLTQITPDNVGALEVAWEFRTGDMPPGDEAFSNQNTPLKVGDRLLLCSAMNKVFALDAATGTQFWTYDPQVPLDAIPYNATCRGLAYYQAPGLAAGDLCAERVIMNTLDARLIALDIQTGQLCSDFGNDGIVNLLEGIGDTAPSFYAPTSPPTIVRNIAVVASQVRDGQTREAPSGVVRGYDAETGALTWAWDLGRPGETGPLPEGEIYTPGTPNVWTIASGDNELGLVYLPMGNSAVDYWGGDRSEEENTYSTALVALDVTNGQVRWFYQTVHYDIWDYDLGSQGTLVDFPTEAGPVPALILPSKQGQFFIFNRETGELLVNVEEQPAPQGGVEPERLSPTQPFVTDFPNQLKADLQERNMWGITPLDQLWCRIQYRQASYEGRYTPPTADTYWIQYPGYNGGSDWGGIAVDPERNILISNYNDTPNYNRLVPRAEVDAMGIVPIGDPNYANNPDNNVSPQALTPYGIEVNAGWRVPFTGMLCKEPPYGGIMAIDLDTREVLWDRPFGTARKNGPFGIPSMLPLNIGTPNNGGGVLTASGLFFIAAATDDLIRAIDISTGETVWQAELPAGGQAGPAMYEANGQQFLVINAGGHNFMETPIGDYFIAYALPSSAQ